MLDFCAAHHLSADVEIIPAKDVNKAWKVRELGARAGG